MAQGSPDAAAIYAALPENLQKDAWSVAMQRLCYTDPQESVNWLAAHVNDPGRNYQSTFRLVQELAAEDPAGTAKWAAQLPETDPPGDPRPHPTKFDPPGQGNRAMHPAYIAVSLWLRTEPAAAAAWLQTQDPSSLWVADLQARLAARPVEQ